MLEGRGRGLGLLSDNSRGGLQRAYVLLQSARTLLPKDPSDHLLDVLLLDLKNYSDCPTDKDLVELALWRRIRRVRDGLCDVMSPSAISVVTKRPTPNTYAAKSFREFYVAEYAEKFSKELTELREAEEGFDEQKLNMLVECMESGIDFFDSVERDLARVASLKGGKRKRLKGKNGADSDHDQNELALNLRVDQKTPHEDASTDFVQFSDSDGGTPVAKPSKIPIDDAKKKVKSKDVPSTPAVAKEKHQTIVEPVTKEKHNTRIDKTESPSSLRCTNTPSKLVSEEPIIAKKHKKRKKQELHTES